MKHQRNATLAFATLACLASTQACSAPVVGDDSGPDATITDATAVPDARADSAATDSSTCPTGQTACSGRCSDTQIDPANCGACGTACSATQSCRAGRCVTVCAEGQTMCGTTCTSLQNDRANCGMCGTACAAGQVCSMGMCAASCGTGLTDCAGRCRDVTSDPAACGACGMACPSGANSNATCSASACGVSCARGFGNCNGMAADGCETALDSADNCGGCGVACRFNNAAGTCGAMGCAMGSCNAGFADCDMSAANGCEVDTRGDRANCGACGTVCGAGQVCSMGMCVATCRMGLMDCMGSCRDTANDPGNCGACGTTCTANANQLAVCAASRCAAVCATGFADCDRTAANGCEIDSRTSVNNCGACGAVCALPANATAACAAGACGIGACNAGFANCNMNATDGCEVDTRVDRANCGACGATCGATEACSAGACVPFVTVAPVVIPNTMNCTTAQAINGTRVTVDSAGDLTAMFTCNAGSELRFSRSTDAGATWSAAAAIPMLAGAGTVNGVAITSQGTTLYIAYLRAARNWFGVSTDRGATWTFTDLATTSSLDALSIQAYNDNVYVAADLGSTFRVLRNSTRGVGAFTATNLATATNIAYGDVIVNPLNGDVWIGYDTPSVLVARSTDNGATFTAFTTPAGSCFYSDFAIGADVLWAVGSTGSTLSRVALPAGTSGTIISGLNYGGAGQATTVAAGADGSAYVASTQSATPFITLDKIAATDTTFTAMSMRRAIDTTAGSTHPSVIQLPRNRGAALVYTRASQVWATIQTY